MAIPRQPALTPSIALLSGRRHWSASLPGPLSLVDSATLTSPHPVHLSSGQDTCPMSFGTSGTGLKQDWKQ